MNILKRLALGITSLLVMLVIFILPCVGLVIFGHYYPMTATIVGVLLFSYFLGGKYDLT